MLAGAGACGNRYLACRWVQRRPNPWRMLDVANIAPTAAPEQFGESSAGLLWGGKELIEERIARRPASFWCEQCGDGAAAVKGRDNAARGVGPTGGGNQLHCLLARHAKRDKRVYRRITDAADDCRKVAQSRGLGSRWSVRWCTRSILSAPTIVDEAPAPGHLMWKSPVEAGWRLFRHRCASHAEPPLSCSSAACSLPGAGWAIAPAGDEIRADTGSQASVSSRNAADRYGKKKIAWKVGRFMRRTPRRRCGCVRSRRRNRSPSAR